MLTLAGHGFYWFELAKPAEPVEAPVEELPAGGSSAVADDLLAAGLVSDGEDEPRGGDR
jgi:maltose alpha-D-glucosyltransferase/alpha-amylase